MHQVLLIIDVQPSFNPPDWLVDGINALLAIMPSVATVERHDESITPVRPPTWLAAGARRQQPDRRRPYLHQTRLRAHARDHQPPQKPSAGSSAGVWHPD